MTGIRLIPRFNYSFGISDILRSFILIKKNERRVRSYFRNRRILFLNSGRAGLYLLLRSIANGRNLKVGVQIYTCQTVFEAITNAECTPVFFEIKDNFSIDDLDIEKRKDQIDILIVTHTFGVPVDVEKLKRTFKGKIVIEDCAHSFLSEIQNTPCGLAGDASVFSMGYGKFPSIGHAGFIIINNEQLLDKSLSEYNKLDQPGIFFELVQVFKNYLYSVAFNPIIYGLITYPVFKELDKKYDFLEKYSFNKHKGYIVNERLFFNNYTKYLKENNERKAKANMLISLLNEKSVLDEISGGNFYIFPLITNRNKQIVEKLMRLGYECAHHFAKSPEIAEHYGYKKGSLPNSERIAREIVTLPIHPGMNNTDLITISAVINQILSE